MCEELQLRENCEIIIFIRIFYHIVTYNSEMCHIDKKFHSILVAFQQLNKFSIDIFFMLPLDIVAHFERIQLKFYPSKRERERN